jgi:hypothetical protein
MHTDILLVRYLRNRGQRKMLQNNDSTGDENFDVTGSAPSAAFVICVEAGSLEYKALCLMLTLRKNWGRWAKLPIYAYSPRSNSHPSAWIFDVYEQLEVTPVTREINTRFPDYPLANKPLSMAHAESTLNKELLVFLDSDILCWRPPELFQLYNGADISLVVDGTKTVASSGPGDRYEEMWRRVYDISGARAEPYVSTMLTNERVRGWWSSGVIVCRRSAGIMNRWMECFGAISNKVDVPPEAEYLREQISLSAIVASVYDHFAPLPVAYNYPVQNYAHYSRLGVSPHDAVLWHYQLFLNRAFRKLENQMERTATTQQRIAMAEKFISRVHIEYPKMLGRDESLVRSLRRKMKLGVRLRKMFGIPKDSDAYV